MDTIKVLKFESSIGDNQPSTNNFSWGHLPGPQRDNPPYQMSDHEVCAVETIEQFLMWYPQKIWQSLEKKQGTVVIYKVPRNKAISQKHQTVIDSEYIKEVKRFKLTTINDLKQIFNETPPKSNHI